MSIRIRILDLRSALDKNGSGSESRSWTFNNAKLSNYFLLFFAYYYAKPWWTIQRSGNFYNLNGSGSKHWLKYYTNKVMRSLNDQLFFKTSSTYHSSSFSIGYSFHREKCRLLIKIPKCICYVWMTRDLGVHDFGTTKCFQGWRAGIKALWISESKAGRRKIKAGRREPEIKTGRREP